MTYTDIIYEKKDRIAKITLNRPLKLNALSRALLTDLDRAFEEANSDMTISVLVIKAAGRDFCAGYDLAPLPPGEGTDRSDVFAVRQHEMSHIGRWFKLWNLGKPTIGQVHGYCLAGGAELAAACDIVICADDAKFGYPIIRGTGTAPCPLWAYHMGQRKVKEYLFTSDYLNGLEAVELGLANRAVPAEKLEKEVNDLAERIAKAPLELLSLNKESINGVYDTRGLPEALKHSFAVHCIGHATQTTRQFYRLRDVKGLKEAIQQRDTPFKT